MVVASASLAEAVIPTVVPLVAFSSTASAVASVSLGAVTLNSSRSFRLIVKVASAVDPSALVARIVMSCVAAACRPPGWDVSCAA